MTKYITAWLLSWLAPAVGAVIAPFVPLFTLPIFLWSWYRREMEKTLYGRTPGALPEGPTFFRRGPHRAKDTTNHPYPRRRPPVRHLHGDKE